MLDLPGTYSLSPQSLDEQVARDVLLGRLPEVPLPDLVVVVVDAANLERNLYYATQVLELGYPTVIALNMVDVARDQGQAVDALPARGGVGRPGPADDCEHPGRAPRPAGTSVAPGATPSRRGSLPPLRNSNT